MVHDFARLLADPSRATILYGLLDGRAQTAGELARLANISPQNASMHLRKLTSAGLLRQSPSGRHIYYRLGNYELATAPESLRSWAVQIAAPESKTGTN